MFEMLGVRCLAQGGRVFLYGVIKMRCSLYEHALILPRNVTLIDTMYQMSILTDMRMMHIRLDDDLANLLDKAPNKSEIVRQALKLYLEGIQTGKLDGMRAAFAYLTKQNDALTKLLKDMDSKLDYIGARVPGSLR